MVWGMLEMKTYSLTCLVHLVNGLIFSEIILILRLVCDVFLSFCHFPIWCPGPDVGLDIIDS